MPRDYRLQVDDILEAIARVREYTAQMSEDTFASDHKTQDAVIRNLEIIGEAARNLPEDIRDSTDHIEWHKIIAFRNVLIHEYFGINVKILWDVITNKLDDLETTCRGLL